MARRKVETNGDHATAPVPVDDRPPDHEPEAPPVNRPVRVLRFGSVKATVWLNQTAAGPRHAVTVARRYRDDQGEWQNTGSFGLSDLLPLAKALDWAHTFISEEIAGAGRDGDTPF